MPRRCRWIWLGLLGLAGCIVVPPGLTPEELRQLERLDHERGRLRLHWRKGQLTRELVEEELLLPALASVAQAVSARIGVEPPPTAIVLWVPGGMPGAGPVHTTHGALQGGRLVFRHRYDPDDPNEPAQLVGIAAHEMTEASVLACLVSLDPYLRWMHDGLAELAEHEELRLRYPEVARATLLRDLELVRAQRERGVTRIDLLRWRQLVPWVVRSLRFLDEKVNLSLVDLADSRRRVREGLARPLLAPERRRGLEELLSVLDHVEQEAARPWAAEEAAPEDPVLHDVLFYVAARAVWLHLEREAPGAPRRAVAELLRRRDAGDGVLSAAEGSQVLEAAAAGLVTPLPLRDLPLARVEEVLAAELARMGHAPPE